MKVFLYVVLATVSAHAAVVPNSSTTDTIPARAQEVCAVDTKDYGKSDVIKAWCDEIPQWQKRVHQLEGGSPKNCHIDPRTKEMICSESSSCKGGEVGHYRKVTTNTDVTYDCKTSCGAHGALLISCCNECAMITPAMLGNINGQPVDKVSCTGCAHDDLKSAAANDARCSFEDGKYECTSSAECNTGSPVTQSSQTVQYGCDVEDCDMCGGVQLKAKCCTECLKRTCDSAQPRRMACLGCDKVSAAPKPIEIQPPAAATGSTGAGFGHTLTVIGIVVLAVACICQQKASAEMGGGMAEQYDRLP